MILASEAKRNICGKRTDHGFAVSTYVAVAEAIREEISTGKYPVGTQLPPERQLAQRFGVAYLTVRRSVGLLARKGMVSRRHGHGTFVESATDKMLIGVLFGPSLAEESAYFYRAALKAIREQLEAGDWTCRAYDGLTDIKGMPQPDNAPIHRHLRTDFRNYGFHGVIEFAPGVKGLEHLEELRGLASSRFEPPRPDTDVKLDTYGFGREAVEFLARSGRRRVAVIRAVLEGGSRADDLTGVLDAARELGLPQPCTLKILLSEAIGRQEGEVHKQAREFIQSWSTSGQPPDALVVSDDIAMRAVALALVESGIRVPHNVRVVCLASEGIALHYGIPVVRYEFSLHELAHQLWEILQRRIQNEALPQLPVLIRGRIKPAEM